MRKRAQFPDSQSKTAAMITDLLNRHTEKPQAKIAEAIGISGPSACCFMTQVKSGRTKMPIERIVPMCVFLNEDPRELLLTAITEYQPGIVQALSDANLTLC